MKRRPPCWLFKLTVSQGFQKLTLNLKCFAFDGLDLERRPELDFHANSIRMGNDALIDLNKNDHWFQLISLTGTVMMSYRSVGDRFAM